MSGYCQNHGPYIGTKCPVCIAFQIDRIKKWRMENKRHVDGDVYVEECAYCGNRPYMIEISGGHGYMIGCVNCFGQGPCTHQQDEALKGWNDEQLEAKLFAFINEE